MQTTAKNFQLLDASGINISPATDITSLYYEIERENRMGGSPIVARKYVYSGFPVAVNIDQNVCTNIGKISDESYMPSSNKYYKITDSFNQDIIVSNVSTSVIPGTTYRQFDIKNYNLTEILKSYVPKEAFNSSVGQLNTSVNNLYNSITAEAQPLSWFLNNTALIPGKFYIINDYYSGGNGCMLLPSNKFSGPTSSSPKKLLVKAFDQRTLDGKLYEMYNKDNTHNNVYGSYIIKNNKIQITYLKDLNGNEAVYDFKNLQYRISNNTSPLHTFPDCIVNNNIIKVNPYISNIMPIFHTDSDGEITNNYIGPGTSIILYISGLITFKNNIVNSNNNISISTSTNAYMNIQNMIMNNNNSISISGNNGALQTGITYTNIYINNGNTIILDKSTPIPTINKMIVNSGNNITIKKGLSDSVSNITIMNNCNSSINLNSNIVVDGVTLSSFNASSNSVYLFGQNVYAGSFNTFR